MRLLLNPNLFAPVMLPLAPPITDLHIFGEDVDNGDGTQSVEIDWTYTGEPGVSVNVYASVTGSSFDLVGFALFGDGGIFLDRIAVDYRFAWASTFGDGSGHYRPDEVFASSTVPLNPL